MKSILLPAFSKRILSLLVVVAVGCLTTMSSQAYSTTASACSSVFGGCITQTGTVSAYATNVGVGVGSPGRTYSAIADASTGALHAVVGATAEDAGGQDARAIASFDDVINFNVPAGTTQFSVIISMFLNGSCTGTPGQSSCVPQMGAMAGAGLNTINLNLLVPGMVSGTLTLQSGNNLPISGFLDVRCHAGFGFCMANFADTGLLALSSPTPGVSFFSASGHDYSLAAIPEPSTWALLLSGVGLLCSRQRWHRAYRRTRSQAARCASAERTKMTA